MPPEPPSAGEPGIRKVCAFGFIMSPRNQRNDEQGRENPSSSMGSAKTTRCEISAEPTVERSAGLGASMTRRRSCAGPFA